MPMPGGCRGSSSSSRRAGRRRTRSIPPSGTFSKSRLHEGISVLDIGCAQGGFASIIGEHVGDFSYTGPRHQCRDGPPRRPEASPPHFPPCAGGRLLGARRGALRSGAGPRHPPSARGVARYHRRCLEAHRRMPDSRPARDGGAQHRGQIDFLHEDGFSTAAARKHARTTIPYNIINADEASGIVKELCRGASRVLDYGYEHPVDRRRGDASPPGPRPGSIASSADVGGT